jgi:hypothetical protein
LSTAPALTSFASFASGWNELVARSVTDSIAVLNSSVTSTNAIASTSAISSSFDTSYANAPIRTPVASRKWMRMLRCVLSTQTMPSNA